MSAPDRNLPPGGSASSARQLPASSQQQPAGYLQGHRRNPLTTTPLGGRVLSASQLLWFTLWPPQGFGVLTTTGRKTGKPRRKCVRAILHGDRIYLVSLRGPHAAWIHNLRADPRVQLRLRQGTFTGLAREIEDADKRQQAHEVYCTSVNAFDRFEYRMHRAGTPTRERIRALHGQWFSAGIPVVIEVAVKES
jgi:deazaflavin-dependent oxidoreductase (nitroreductase family)